MDISDNDDLREKLGKLGEGETRGGGDTGRGERRKGDGETRKGGDAEKVPRLSAPLLSSLQRCKSLLI